MIRLYDAGAYLVHGTDIIADDRDAAAKLKQAVGGHIPSREEAAKETIAYSILKDHNTSGTMDKLKIKFDLPRHHVCGYHPDSARVGTGKISGAIRTDELSQLSVCGRWYDQ